MSLPWSFIGAPAVTFPCSTYDNGLPGGVQVTSGQGFGCRGVGCIDRTAFIVFPPSSRLQTHLSGNMLALYSGALS